MAASSSKRNSASARASSVLPTPVGPRKMKEPMGRLGSCRPARERRTAVGDRRQRLVLAHHPLASSRSSMWSSFSISPSSSRETGMRGPAGDHLGDVLRRRPPP